MPARIIKVTLPRPAMSGGLAERDFDGVQQFAPLLDIPVALGLRLTDCEGTDRVRGRNGFPMVPPCTSDLPR